MVCRLPGLSGREPLQRLDKVKNEEGEDKMDKYVCDVCGYVYDPAVGDPDNGVPAGTPWEKVPDTWTCPECGAGKDQFSKQ